MKPPTQSKNNKCDKPVNSDLTLLDWHFGNLTETSFC